MVDVEDDDDDSGDEQQPAVKGVDLESLYYNPRTPGSFGGVDALYRSARGRGQMKTKDDIREWFESQPAYTLHKPSRIKFRRNVILVHGIDEQFQADLADMSMLKKFNDDAVYLLTCIDVLSKYAWVIPIGSKHARNIKTAFEKIFKERKPLKLQTDLGTEFTNETVQNYMKEVGVQHFFTWNPDIKASIVERFNRTIKQKLYKYMTYKDTKRYIDVLPDMVHSYNNTYHRSIKMTPTEASQPENEKQVWQNLYGGRISTEAPAQGKKKQRVGTAKFKYQIGDYVRLSEERGVFQKGYKQRWTEEVYRVAKRSARDPVVYRLEDLIGEPLIGSFYELELQRVSKPESEAIDKILLQEQGQQEDPERPRQLPKGEHDLEFYVKQRGYPDYDNRFGLQRQAVAAAAAAEAVEQQDE
jgi:transposase InsO family protein